MIFIFDEFLDFRRSQRPLERLKLRAIGLAGTNSNNICVRRIFGFNGDGVFDRIQAGAEREVAVDHGKRDVFERARQLCGLDFYDLELFRVVCNICRRLEEWRIGAQLDEADMLKQQKRSAAVCWVVRYRDCAVFADVLRSLERY